MEMSVSGIQYKTSRVILNIMVCRKITLRTGYNANTLSNFGSSNLGGSGNLYSKQGLYCHQSYPHPLKKKNDFHLVTLWGSVILLYR